MEIILAMLPLGVSIFALLVLQRDGKQAGIATLITTIVLSLIFPPFHLLPSELLIAFGQGFSASLMIFYLLLPSLILYHLLKATGAMNILGWGITRLVPDRNLQVLLLVMGLAPFAESVSGFGVGTILVIPIFIALDFGLGQSAILGILGQMAVPWGGLGIGTVLGAELTNLDPGKLGAYTALLTAPLPVLYGLVALSVSGGKKSLHYRWPVAIVMGSVLTASLYVFSLTAGVELAGLLASAITIFIAIVWGQIETKWHQGRGKFNAHAASQSKKVLDTNLNKIFTAHKTSTSQLFLLQAMAPYIVLTTFLLISRLIIPIRLWLQSHFVLSIPTINLHLPLLYNPGFSLLITVFATIKILGIGVLELRVALVRAWRQFIPGAVAIACFLIASQIMQINKMTGTIGATTAIMGHNYKWIAPWIAALGGLITGSNTSSNALFSQLQLAVSTQAGLPLTWLMGVQNGASSYATMIAPTRTILAATAVGLHKGEAFLLRQIAPLVIVAVTITMLLLALAI